MHRLFQVQLIGYCTKDFLFLVYEYVENGTLDQHLHSAKGKTLFVASKNLMTLQVGFSETPVSVSDVPSVELMCSAGKATLSWSSRVQIALDAARGLEYIHEHTKPTYIHRDIKSANILLDKECHAKVHVFS